ncbi:hypothetical protein BMI91_19650 [Thioclava sediminum]|uniref:Terminase n=1 Tax=Thioclava sediminum TaxID=1915319 RepID=A0ABX3MS28_9RHOB|nr:terminase gpA endonuclease subunit [Thioclava sediminum]OOY22499.1 hypothetical protein BMI91_19650 [Thioclava sediminum]
MTLSQWADEFGRLSVETSAEPGRWKTFGPQREPMDAMTDIKIRRVVMMKGVRIGFTKALLWLSAYHMHWDPASILFFQPTDDDAKDFDESEILPMIRDTSEVRELSNVSFSGGKAKEQWHTRKFKNGAIFRMRGAAAEGNFRRLTTRINIADEIDDKNWDDKSGDKLTRLKKRGTTFWNSKLILGGSPVLPADQGGRTHAEFLDSDQRHLYVKCPHCGHKQIMEFGNGEGAGVRYNDDLSDVYYQCSGERACRIEEEARLDMLEAGEWIPHNPGHPDRGYHYPQILSQFVTWKDIAREWKTALRGGMKKIKVFKNEVEGIPFFEEAGQSADAEELLDYVVDYGGEAPTWTEVVTVGVDVQKGNQDGTMSYLEASVYAWGRGGRFAQIGHWVLDEHPLTSQAAWDSLEALGLQSFTDADGVAHRVDALCIDSHGGFSQRVYSWIEAMRRKGRRRWFAVRGANNAPGARKEKIWPNTAANKNPILYTIDVSLAKDELAIALSEGKGEFPAIPMPGAEEMTREFFDRLTREKQVPVAGRPGLTKWTSPKNQEPWDCLVYAYAGTHALRAMPGSQKYKRKLAEDIRPIVTESEPASEEPKLSELAMPTGPRRDPEPAPEPQVRQKPTPRQGLIKVRPGFGYR